MSSRPQARLVSRLGEVRGESPPPAFMGIVETLNKVGLVSPLTLTLARCGSAR